jgi:hypothetical protein
MAKPKHPAEPPQEPQKPRRARRSRAAERSAEADETPEADEISDPYAETPAQRRRRRALFLRELAEARALRERVHPRRTKAQRMRQAARMRTFRF